MARRKIVVNPDEMDADIVDCPLADQDNYCGLASGGAAVECNILEDRCSCPLNAGSVEVSLAEADVEQAKEFYVQRPDQEFDGLIHFWTKGDHGYAPQISAARVFDLEEIESMHSIKYEEKIAWPKEYIDAKAIDNKVAQKDCDIKESYKTAATASN